MVKGITLPCKTRTPEEMRAYVSSLRHSSAAKKRKVKQIKIPDSNKLQRKCPAVLRKMFWERLFDFEVPGYAKKFARRGRTVGRRYPTSRSSKMHLLRKMSEVAVARKYDSKAVRDTFAHCELGPAAKHECFVCGRQAFAWHHIIQVQNGGTNHRGNLLPLCERCHGEVHPWLEAESPEARRMDREYLEIISGAQS